MNLKLSILSAAASLLLCTAASAQVWAPQGNRIRTPWAEEVLPYHSHMEYPRPQMFRGGYPLGWKSLNGLWDYAIVKKDSKQPQSFDGKILVPFCVESSLSGVGKTVTKEDEIWYQTSFTVNPQWQTGRVLLNFEAVDWKTDVWVNGQYVGDHTGGYTHFSFDITPYLTSGEQQLTVRVYDGTDNDFQPRGKQVSKPHGIWYTAVSGIWQSVWLEAVGDAYVTDYYAVSNIDRKTIDVLVEAKDLKPGDYIKVVLRDGGVGYSTESFKDRGKIITSAVANADYQVRLSVPDAKFWSPDSPYLYGLDILVFRGDRPIDIVRGYTAMREISVVKDAQGHKRMALNKKPLFHMGPLDQGWWPDGLYTAPTDEALKFDIVKTKDFGFNMIRKHIKVEPARWYYYCDQLGIMVWQDMPSFGVSKKWGRKHYDEGEDFPATPAAKANYYKEWGEIINQLKKFQCIVVWVPFNEAWSQFDTRDAIAFTRDQESTRLINMASGGNWTPACGDILDSHHYPNPGMNIWDPDMVNVLGEYGGIGLPLEGHLWQPDRNWGYVQYKNGEEVLKVYSQYADELADLVRQGVSAAVYTQTTDVEGEVNGIMTYDRKVVKMDEKALKAVNQKIIKSME